MRQATIPESKPSQGANAIVLLHDSLTNDAPATTKTMQCFSSRTWASWREKWRRAGREDVGSRKNFYVPLVIYRANEIIFLRPNSRTLANCDRSQVGSRARSSIENLSRAGERERERREPLRFSRASLQVYPTDQHPSSPHSAAVSPSFWKVQTPFTTFGQLPSMWVSESSLP